MKIRRIEVSVYAFNKINREKNRLKELKKKYPKKHRNLRISFAIACDSLLKRT